LIVSHFSIHPVFLALAATLYCSVIGAGIMLLLRCEPFIYKPLPLCVWEVT